MFVVNDGRRIEMSYYPILLGSVQLSKIDGISPRCERYKFQRGTQPGGMSVGVGDAGVWHRVETTTALEARGLSAVEHRRYLKALPETMTHGDAAEAFNLSTAAMRYLGVVDDDGMVNVRNAFEALRLDTNLLGTVAR
ncbi:hypothetical protein GS921_15505 [Rhodococcus hoagii]|nr:hypothetical protein [Prescottella equi]